MFEFEDEKQTLCFNKIKELNCGENSHQNANLYGYNNEIDWKLLAGFELSYCEILDATLALEIATEFYDVSGIISIKNQTPTVVSLGANLDNAFDKAIDSNPLDTINSIIALTKEINASLAKKLSSIKPNVILAPKYEAEAIEILKKSNAKIIQINTEIKNISKYQQEEIRLTPFGALIQQKNNKDLDVKTFKVTTKKKPEQREVEDMIFAFKIAKHLKSATAVIAKDLRTIGLCSNAPSEVSALEVAISKVCDSTKDSVVAYDNSINTIDNIQIIAQNRISALIQAGGSLKDREIIELADKYNISMITTGIRHLKY